MILINKNKFDALKKLIVDKKILKNLLYMLTFHYKTKSPLSLLSSF